MIIANISLVNVPSIASSVRYSGALTIMIALIIMILARSELRGVFQRSKTPEEMVRQVLNIVGFTRNEATSLMSNFNLERIGSPSHGVHGRN